MSSYDVAVIGGGHNGLVAAAYLAKGGRKVVVLERRDVLGGLAATEELWPGYRVDTGWWDADLFLDQVIAALQLAQHGLEFIASPAAALTPTADGQPLTLWRDVERTRDEIARLSKVDAERYPAFVEQMARLGSIVRAARSLTPPDIETRRLDDLMAWGRVALAARRLGRVDLMELLRVLPLPARQLLDEQFESDPLKALFAAGSVTGSLLGPFEVGTTFMMLYQGLMSTRGARYVRGGVGKVSDALAAAATSAGAELRTGVNVDRIVVRSGRACELLLDGGASIGATTILSTADPRHTLFDLVGADKLPLGDVRKLRNVRMRGAMARLFLAVDELPPNLFGVGRDDERLTGRIVLAPSVEAIERAYDASKYGEVSPRPLVELRIPTLLDPSLAPDGKHIVVVQAHFVPYELAKGNGSERRDEVAATLLDVVEESAPGLRAGIAQQEFRTPADIERIHGATRGDVFHGQMELDQLLHMRPIGGSARYRTAIDGLWIGGAGSHPGGGLTGAPGFNAAREIVRARR